VVSLIRLSDQTHQANSSWDKRAWPVYMTIGNICSRMRNSTSKNQIPLQALLPVPPKFTCKSSHTNKAQREINADTLWAIVQVILVQLQRVAQAAMVMDCVDGKTNIWFPSLLTWIPDHDEHVALKEIGGKSCPMCKVPCEDLGWNLLQISKYSSFSAMMWNASWVRVIRCCLCPIMHSL